MLCVHCRGSLANNDVVAQTDYIHLRYGGGYRGTYITEGINALCEALKSTTTLTSLKYASHLEPSCQTVNSL